MLGQTVAEGDVKDELVVVSVYVRPPGSNIDQ